MAWDASLGKLQGPGCPAFRPTTQTLRPVVVAHRAHDSGLDDRSAIPPGQRWFPFRRHNAKSPARLLPRVFATISRRCLSEPCARRGRRRNEDDDFRCPAAVAFVAAARGHHAQRPAGRDLCHDGVVSRGHGHLSGGAVVCSGWLRAEYWVRRLHDCRIVCTWWADRAQSYDAGTDAGTSCS